MAQTSDPGRPQARDLSQDMHATVLRHCNADGKIDIDVLLTACFTVMIAYLKQMPRNERVRKYTEVCAKMLTLVTGA